MLCPVIEVTKVAKIDSKLGVARPIEVLDLNGEQRRGLERMFNASTTPQRMVARAGLVLSGVAGRSQEATIT